MEFSCVYHPFHEKVIVTIFKSFRKNLLRFFIVFVTMLALMAPLVWWKVSYPHHAENINAIISQHGILLLVFRWLLIVTLFLFWRSLIGYLGTKKGWSVEKTQFWQNQRLKITLWLILFEVVLCENLLLKLIHLIEGFV